MPSDVIRISGSRLLAVSDFGRDQLLILDTAGELLRSIPVARQPFFLAAHPSRQLVAVGHLIPETPATSPASAASVSLVDPIVGSERQVRLPYGSSNVRQLAFSPDGAWLYVLHTLGRVLLPTTQLERGWINTNAISLIAVGEARHNRLNKENADLRRRLKSNSRNSSRPPSSDRYTKPKDEKRENRSPKRKKGAQPGHKGTQRALVDAQRVDKIVACHPDSCACCGGALDQASVEGEPNRMQQWDCPPPPPIITEFQRYYPFFFAFAQASFKPTVLLNTSLSGWLSGSVQK